MHVCMCGQVKETDWNAALDKHQGDWQAAAYEVGAGQGCGGCRVYLEVSSNQWRPAPVSVSPVAISSEDASPHNPLA